MAGNDPEHMKTARALAHEFHRHGVQLVYGGGTSGLMGELARTLVSLSGPKAVHGIIPRALVRVEFNYDPAQHEKEEAEQQGPGQGSTMTHGKGTERTVSDVQDKASLLQESVYGMTTIVADMHMRKRQMATEVIRGGPGSGFVTLAGGFGTIEEVMEMTTWNQLGIHKRGIILMNVNGYWDGLLAWVKNAVEKGYIGPDNANILVEAKSVNEVCALLSGYKVSAGQMKLDWGEE